MSQNNSTMSRMFANFLNINIGHVAICVVFIFGLGICWSQVTTGMESLRVQRENDRADQKVQRENDAILATARLEAVTKRVFDLETSSRETAQVLGALRDLQSEVRYYGKQFDELKADVRSQRK